MDTREELWARWQELEARNTGVMRQARSIIQNDIPITRKELITWLTDLKNRRDDLDMKFGDLLEETVSFVRRDQDERARGVKKTAG